MGNVLTVHMKANKNGTNKNNVDYDWNNGTLLGELIEKALLKNTPAQKKTQLNPTDYNSVLIKKACCLGLVHDGKRDESKFRTRRTIGLSTRRPTRRRTRAPTRVNRGEGLPGRFGSRFGRETFVLC